MQFKVSTSITDTPVFSRMESFFKEFKKAGIDGVEVTIGFKSRFRLRHIAELSREYDLPITSIHQSVWSAAGIHVDDRFIEKAKSFGINTYVFHPLPLMKIDNKRMEKYFLRLQRLQEQYDITICLENMTNKRFYKPLYRKKKSMEVHLEELCTIAKTYNLSLTYDTSHARFVHPSNEAIFAKILPKVQNIHLSSFHGKKEHLPLSMGDFDTRTFILYLKRKKYTGLITLEIYYPAYVTVRKYNYEAIKNSIAIVKSI